MRSQSVDIQPVPSRKAAFDALKTELNTMAAAGRRAAAERTLPTGISALDTLFGGGLPKGTLIAMEGTAGAWSIVARLAAEVTRRALAAIVDDGALYPPTLAQAGTRLDRVLIVPARSPLGIARAVDILLRSRACRLVVMPAPSLRAAVWSRLANLAHRTGVVLVAVASGLAAAPLSAAAGVRLFCARERALVSGLRGVWSTFCGYVVRAEVRKAPARAAGAAVSLRVVAGERNVRERAVISNVRTLRAALR